MLILYAYKSTTVIDDTIFQSTNNNNNNDDDDADDADDNDNDISYSETVSESENLATVLSVGKAEVGPRVSLSGGSKFLGKRFS